MIIDLPKRDGPQLPRHFGLRATLLAVIAMAVVLGLVVWMNS